MCGVIGVYLSDVSDNDIEVVDNIFRQTMIRGKHATGVTVLRDGELQTIKEPIPANEFLEKYPIQSFVHMGSLKLIGHIRYSTSDLRYNQPFQGRDISIAHNGVISQDPSKWEYETETLNDSELILRCIESGDSPLEIYRNRSMACVSIQDDVLYGWRNHERPLWYAKRQNGLLFCSTKDILNRSGVESDIDKCLPLVLYSFSGGLLQEDRSYYDEQLEDLQ